MCVWVGWGVQDRLRVALHSKLYEEKEIRLQQIADKAVGRRGLPPPRWQHWAWLLGPSRTWLPDGWRIYGGWLAGGRTVSVGRGRSSWSGRCARSAPASESSSSRCASRRGRPLALPRVMHLAGLAGVPTCLRVPGTACLGGWVGGAGGARPPAQGRGAGEAAQDSPREREGERAYVLHCLASLVSYTHACKSRS